MRKTVAFVSVSVLSWLLHLGVASPALAINWFDDFEDGDITDGDPVTWTFNELGLTPGIHDASSGDLELSAPGMSDDDSLVPSVDINFPGDVYARTRAVIEPGPGPDEVGGNVGIGLRFNPSTFSGYVAILDDGGLFAVIRSDGGALTVLDEFSEPGIDAATEIMMEFNFVGNEWDLFLWRPGESKPENPISWGTDNTYSSGRAGLVYNEDDDNTIGVFRWAAAQDTPFVDELDGDFNADGTVDARDYTIWRNGLGGTFVDTDYDTWKAQFGMSVIGGSLRSAGVPEPSTFPLAVLVATIGLWRRRLTSPLTSSS